MDNKRNRSIRYGLTNLATKNGMSITMTYTHYLRRFFNNVGTLLITIRHLNISTSSLATLYLSLLIRNIRIIRLLRTKLTTIRPRVRRHGNITHGRTIIRQITLWVITLGLKRNNTLYNNAKDNVLYKNGDNSLLLSNAGLFNVYNRNLMLLIQRLVFNLFRDTRRGVTMINTSHNFNRIFIRK